MTLSRTSTVRPAVPGDAGQLVRLVTALLEHLGDPVENFSAERFIDDAFGREPQFSVRVAAEGGTVDREP